MTHDKTLGERIKQALEKPHGEESCHYTPVLREALAEIERLQGDNTGLRGITQSGWDEANQLRERLAQAERALEICRHAPDMRWVTDTCANYFAQRGESDGPL